MAQANERKSVLRQLGLDRIATALFSSERNFGEKDSSARDSEPTEDGPSVGRESESGGATRGRILTPEERIVELVEERGGRMKQAEVVANIEWSESTVSRKLQRLESSGEVTRCQLGREKVVYLPGCEPAALASPFADDEDEKAPLVH